MEKLQAAGVDVEGLLAAVSMNKPHRWREVRKWLRWWAGSGEVSAESGLVASLAAYLGRLRFGKPQVRAAGSPLRSCAAAILGLAAQRGFSEEETEALKFELAKLRGLAKRWGG